MRFLLLFLALVAVAGCASGPAAPPATGRDFTEGFDAAEALPAGWEAAGGRWDLVDEPLARTAPHVMEQRMPTTGASRYLAASQGTFADAEIHVFLRPISGDVAMGGGLVFRFSDPNNYYVAAVDGLAGKVRFVEFNRGVRNDQEAPLAAPLAPHEWIDLGVRAKGDEIVVSINGVPSLTVRDATLKVGNVGLWTQDDADTQFDDVSAKRL